VVVGLAIPSNGRISVENQPEVRMPGFKVVLCAVAALATTALPVAAQMPDRPFVVAVDGLAAAQGKTDLDGGGSFSATRLYGRAGGLHFFDGGSAGLFVSMGRIDYDFSGTTAPWGEVRDQSLDLTLGFETDRARIFVAPGLNYNFEDGADRDDAVTYGVFAGFGWKFSDSLTLGPAIGLYSELESDDLNVFPAVLVDWKITDRARLSTGPTIGATQGPGLALDYGVTDNLRIGIAGRYENVRFRLDDDGPAPGGIGQDESFPLVVTLDYAPFPGSRLAAFAGAELGGELRLEDAAGRTVETRDYDPAPIFGVAFRVGF
jgi:hypothetical protein